MRTRTALVAAAAALALLAASPLVAEDTKPSKGGGATAARATAEIGFAALRKAVADHDEATLVQRLPAKLVADWPADAAGDAKKWRADIGAKIAAGTVVSVKETGDDAVAVWKTEKPAATYEMKLHFENGQWNGAAVWPYCVSGGEVAKANGKGAAHVKLKARTSATSYGGSGISFVHVTQDAKQCLGRIDLYYCRCGLLHAKNGMLTQLKASDLEALEGRQSGGDSMDQIAPKNGSIYAMTYRCAGRADFQIVFKVTGKSDDVLEFDWRLVVAGRNAPASIRTPQPIPWVEKDADGIDGLCSLPRR